MKNHVEHVANVLAKGLGGSWIITPIHNERAGLVRNDGLELIVIVDIRDSRYIKVRPVPPKKPGSSNAVSILREWGVLAQDEVEPGIRFVLGKADSTILKSVKTKVLAPYEDIYQRILKEKAELETLFANRKTLIERVAVAMGVPVPADTSGDVVLYGRRGDIPDTEAKISHYGELTLRTIVGEETGLAILDFLKSAHAKNKVA